MTRLHGAGIQRGYAHVQAMRIMTVFAGDAEKTCLWACTLRGGAAAAAATSLAGAARRFARGATVPTAGCGARPARGTGCAWGLAPVSLILRASVPKTQHPFC